MSDLGRPFTTLFLLTSVDGKISSGDSETLDVDTDWKRIVGVKEGLNQYYDLEQETDLFSLNSGKTWAKIGFNQRRDEPSPTPVTFVVVDNKPHLDQNGIFYAAKKSKHLIIVTTNSTHSAFKAKETLRNISVIYYPERIDFENLMYRLKSEYRTERLTVQTGGTLNSVLLRAHLIDRLLIVIAPILVGGQMTPALVTGEAIHTVDELAKLTVLDLISCKTLKNSYVQLEYRIRSRTEIV